MSDYALWTQLEPIAFDKTLATELAAPVVDPLWMLARQLQFGEFGTTAAPARSTSR